jgi:hypothetical protein
MIVVCGSCGSPGKVVIDTDMDVIVERYFVCKCPRSPLLTKEGDE